MLIRHALTRYQKTEVLTIYVAGRELVRASLYEIRVMNLLRGRPMDLSLHYGPGTEIVFE